MEKVTLRGRIMLYLSKYDYLDRGMAYGAPLEITQDGVAIALGITRAYSSLMLNRMEEEGLVEHHMATILGTKNKNKRRIYFLTGKGRKEKEALVLDLESKGMDPDDIYPKQDINHCSSDVFESLDLEERDVIGSICLIDGKVSRSSLPGGEHPLIPFDLSGDVLLKDSTKKRILALADEDTLRRWHSLAADWCTDNDKDPGERLRHLLGAGRIREARRLFVRERYGFMESPERWMLDATDDLCRGCDDQTVLEAASRIAMELDETATAKGYASSMTDGTTLKESLLAEIALKEGSVDEALSMALECYNGDSASAIALGKCMLAAGRPSEGRVFLAKARKALVDEGCIFRLDEALALDAECAMEMGSFEEADSILEMVGHVTRNKKLCERVAAVRDRMARGEVSEDCVGLQVVQI
ncbi:MAG: hypothetical protein ACI38Y_02705 [Candidatus Methanomethylophilaceae archaeon]